MTDQPAQMPDIIIKSTRDKAATPATSGPSRVLSGPDLKSRASATLGATLQDEAGVHNASFGPNVGLPIVRGMGGERVKLIVNGAGMHDASSLSADHAVMTDSALAERITITRGPAAIAHGGQAIGGAIEIDDGRIPSRRPSRLSPSLEARGGAQGHVGVIKLEGPAGAQGAWRMDVHQRHQRDVRIPGKAIDEEAVRRQFYMVSARNTYGYINNTDAVTEGGAIGGNWFSEGGRIGASVSTMQQDYGIPTGGHAHQHGGTTTGSSEDVRIKARQMRYTIKGFREAAPWQLGELNWQFTHVDYQHDEMLGPRSETRFENRVNEVRATMQRDWFEHWRTQLGLDAGRRSFSAKGEEAFVPPTSTHQAALFSTIRWQKDAQTGWRWDGGARLERRETTPRQQQNTAQGVTLTLPSRRFDTGSVSVGLTRLHEGGQLSLNRWLVTRAPEVQELYALGPHLATMTYDIGNSALKAETLRGWDLGIVQKLGLTRLEANVFLYESGQYIYQRNTGLFYDPERAQFRALCARLDQCMPMTSYEQAPARLHGYEWQWRTPLLPGKDAWQLTLFGDMVQGSLTNGGDLPRMPPRRWGARLQYQQGAWHGEMRAVRAGSQKRAGDNEQATEGHFQLHANLRWSQRSGARNLALLLTGRNLTNQTVRNSTSHLRLYAPEPGRTIEIGMEIKL